MSGCKVKVDKQHFLIIHRFKKLGLISKASLPLTTESQTIRIMKVSGELLMVTTAVLAANLGILIYISIFSLGVINIFESGNFFHR